MGKATQGEGGPLIYPDPEKAYQGFLEDGFLTRDNFINELTVKGFNCGVSDNKDGNDVLIAVRDCYEIKPFTFEPCYGVAGAEEIPENCRVDIRVGKKTLTVFGVRIKDEPSNKRKRKEYKEQGRYDGPQMQRRRKEFNELLVMTKRAICRGDDHPLLIAGDFNNYQRDIHKKSDFPKRVGWCLDILTTMAEREGLQVVTPEGTSWWRNAYVEFPEDHFLVKGAKVERAEYDWGFAVKQLGTIAPPFPDHAILKGSLILP